MTVEQIRTAPRPPAPLAARPTRTAPRPATGPRAANAPLCLVVPDLEDGDGVSLLRTLRRRESTRAVLLARRAGRRELVVLLNGGVRGAVTSQTPGAVRIVGRAAPASPAVPAPRRPGADLTARELGVLALVSEGRSNRAIGEKLELSALTVKSHLARISRKVGTGDRAEMVAYAIRNGLLT